MHAMRPFTLLLALAAAAASAQQHLPVGLVHQTSHGIQVKQADGSVVELAVEGLTAFRISVAYGAGNDTTPIETPMVDAHASYAPFTVVRPNATAAGIKTAFGAVTLDGATGGFEMVDAAGAVITHTA